MVTSQPLFLEQRAKAATLLRGVAFFQKGNLEIPFFECGEKVAIGLAPG